MTGRWLCLSSRSHCCIGYIGCMNPLGLLAAAAEERYASAVTFPLGSQRQYMKFHNPARIPKNNYSQYFKTDRKLLELFVFPTKLMVTMVYIYTHIWYTCMCICFTYTHTHIYAHGNIASLEVDVNEIQRGTNVHSQLMLWRCAAYALLDAWSIASVRASYYSC